MSCGEVSRIDLDGERRRSESMVDGTATPVTERRRGRLLRLPGTTNESISMVNATATIAVRL
jgi:hypothetical protein